MSDARSRTSTRRRVALLLSAAVAVSLGLAATGLDAFTSARSGCAGEFRWNVKTLSDRAARDVNFKPIATTISALVSLTPPQPLGAATPRSPGPEETTYRVTAALDHMDRQGDGDVHLVLKDPRDGTKMMLAEFPNVACPGANHSLKKRQLRAARLALIHACGPIPRRGVKERLAGKLVITGVGFFDANMQFNTTGIELHPVLALRKISCRRLGASP